MPEFCKTRIIYFENQPSNITIDNYDTKITLQEFDDKDANQNYRIATVKGADHNWHNIPTNYYGCYMTPAELLSCYENYDEFYPKSIECTLAHAVPTAKYAGTTNTTQLSFNNTIYMLTYNLTDTDNVTVDLPAKADLDKYLDLFRTYDGSSFKDSTRILAPKLDLKYKIPSFANGDAFNEPQNHVTINVDVNVTDNWKPNLDISANTDNALQPCNTVLSNKDLKLAMYPDFLQDNTNVKALYPGENMDKFNYTSNDNLLNTIKCAGFSLGESFFNKDMRAYGINSNTRTYIEWLLYQRMFWRSRGPQLRDNTGLSEFNQTQFLLNNFKYEDFTIHALPLWFAKGLPILDPTNNLVAHSFCCTVTWKCIIEGKPRTLAIPRPLRWGHFYIDTLQTVDSVNKDTAGKRSFAYRTRNVATSTWPKKPFQDNHWHGEIHFQRFADSNNTEVNERLSYNNCMPPWGTNTQQIPNDNQLLDTEDVDVNHWKRFNNNSGDPSKFKASIPTKTFAKSAKPAIATQSKLRRSLRLNPF